jgi:RNA polymerase sigma-70 factor (ECF subfamily)
VLAVLGALSGDPDLATEATDEAFARAFGQWHRVSVMASPDGWLYRVALNQIRRTKRRQGLERVFLLHADRRQRDVALPDPDLWQAVRSLPDRQRHAIVLRYLTDLPEAEIAAALGVTRGTVASNLADARRRLEQLLGGSSEER